MVEYKANTMTMIAFLQRCDRFEWVLTQQQANIQAISATHASSLSLSLYKHSPEDGATHGVPALQLPSSSASK